MSELAQLDARLARLRGHRVLVVGDIMLDRYVYGEVDRISPEAPVPIVRVTRETSMLGGAGNVARNLAALDAEVRLVGLLGDDAAGSEVAVLLSREPAIQPELPIEPGRVTSVKTRYIGGAQQLLRADWETAGPPDADRAEALARAAAAADGCAAVVLSDYGKGTLAGDLPGRVIAMAAAAGIPVVVDPKRREFEAYRGAALVTPNRRELAEATGRPVGSDAEIVAAAEGLRRSTGIDAVLVTRSHDGVTLVAGDGAHHLPTEAREVFDVTGAGDTVAAMAALALGAGLAPIEAARLANAAAGIVVGKIGTATASLAEIESVLHRRGFLAGGEKVVDRAHAARLAAAWRAAGERVGFTNGCFDLLHPGHVGLLAFARCACDRLVVGLNSDASVRRLKGEGRPVQSEAARALVLASLAAVDLVVLFEDDTPVELIRALRPDLLVKGADYRLAEVVGRDLVEGYGGEVLLAPIVDGYSTTGLVSAARR